MSAAQPAPQNQREQFLAEVGELAPRLYAAAQELYSPLGELARAHIRDAQPPLRGAVVLATGLGAPDTVLLREQRLLLASALEMLAVALSIHRLLLAASADSSLDKSLVGSTILTGDFCFSRAAVLAARTESPLVVDIFAEALKNVSEGHLRRLFSPQEPTFNEALELMIAGVRAISHLAGSTPAATAAALALAEDTATGAPHARALPPGLSPAQAERRDAFLDWLDTVQQPLATPVS